MFQPDIAHLVKLCYPYNYDLTVCLVKKKTSNHCAIDPMQKVAYIALAIFAAIYETFRNLCSVIRACYDFVEVKFDSISAYEQIILVYQILGNDCPKSYKTILELIQRGGTPQDQVIPFQDIELAYDRLKAKGTTREKIWTVIKANRALHDNRGIALGLALNSLESRNSAHPSPLR